MAAVSNGNSGGEPPQTPLLPPIRGESMTDLLYHTNHQVPGQCGGMGGQTASQEGHGFPTIIEHLGEESINSLESKK